MCPRFRTSPVIKTYHSILRNILHEGNKIEPVGHLAFEPETLKDGREAAAMKKPTA